MSKRASLSGKSFNVPQEASTESHPVDKITNYPPNQVIELPVDRIVPDPEQPRKTFNPEKLKLLSDSIEERGLLQPIAVRLTPENEYVLIAGERRWRAHKIANKLRIKAIITNIDNNDDAFELSLIENTQRENLTPIEEAEGISDLIYRKNYTQTEIGRKIGRSKTQVSRLIKLSKLPKSIKDLVATSQLSRDQLFQIASQPNEKAMVHLFREITEKHLNVRETREKANPPKKPAQPQTIKNLKRAFTFFDKEQKSFLNLNHQEKQEALAYLESIQKYSKTLIEQLQESQ